MAKTLIQTRMKALYILVLALAPALAAASPWDGQWQINFEETDKVTETYEEGSGIGKRNPFGNANVSVGGLPLPSLGGRVPPQSSMPSKDPAVMRCNTMSIETTGDRIKLTYDEDDGETLRKGHYRGRDTAWKKKEIKQKYKTPDRKVTKTWTVRPDGRLLVSVKLNPTKDRARTFNRVFDRVTAEVSPPESP